MLRWCQLDGHQFSIYTHKSKTKARQTFSLLQCSVENGSRYRDPGEERVSSTTIVILHKTTKEILTLKTNNIYEGTDWLDALQAGNTTTKAVPDKDQSSSPPETDVELPAIVAWVCSDTRNPLILTLLGFVMWLLSLY